MKKIGLLFLMALISIVPSVLAQDTTEEVDPAAAYCQSQGGTVVTRYPAGNTNQPDSIIRFAGDIAFCEFSGVDADGLVSIPAAVLYADQPTLAAIAYTYPPPFDESIKTNGANPSYYYCEQLSGAINFGAVNAVGSGWVNEDDPTDVITPCVFADGSMIDAFAIFYKSDGTIRGADLTSRFRWQDAQQFNGMFGG